MSSLLPSLLTVTLAAAPVQEAPRPSPPVAETPAEIAADHVRWLDEVEDLRERGELEAARAHLAASMEAAPYLALAEAPDEVALPAIRRLEAVSGSLGALEVQLVVREERLRRLSERLSEDHPVLLGAQQNLGVTRHALGDTAGALELFEHVHAVRERVLPADDLKLLHAKNNLAAIRYSLGDLAGALALFERIHAARERLLPPDDLDLLSAKLNLGATRQALGDFEGALELFEYVHAAFERLLPADHPDLLTAKQNLGGTRHMLGDLRGALVLEEQVHAARERLLPADHLDLLLAKKNLGATRNKLGDLAGALALEEYAHAAYERLLPADHLELLRTKQNLALTRGALGDLAGALALEEYVHAAFERLLPADHLDLLRAKQNLATRRVELGDLAGALPLVEEVHEAYERLLPADHPDLLRAKQNLAIQRREVLGDPAGALALDEEVHAARERLLPVDHPELLDAKVNLALTRGQLGDLTGALALTEQVHATRVRVLPADHSDLLETKRNLALARWNLDDLDGALVLLEETHAAHERLLPADHPRLLAAKRNLAALRVTLGDLTGAFPLTSAVVAGAPDRASFLATRSPRFARSAGSAELERLSSQRGIMRCSELYTGELDRDLFAGVEAVRLVATSGYDVARAAARFPDVGAVRDELTRVQRELGDLGAAGGGEGVAQRALELSEKRDVLARELRELLREKGIVLPRPSVEGVRAALGDGQVFLSYIAYATGDLVAYVVSKDAFHAVDLGRVDEVAQGVEAWRAALGAPTGRNTGSTGSGAASDERSTRGLGGSADDVGEDEVKLGTSLRARLLDPCLEVLADEPRTLHVVLDDALHLAPFDALPWKDGERLGDAFDVRFANSSHRLLVGSEEIERAGTLVAVGGVDFDAKSDGSVDAFVTPPPVAVAPTRSGGGAGYRPLPATRPEVDAVERLFEEHLGRDDARITTGAEATKTRLGELAPEARFLHVATHGFFASEVFESEREVFEQRASVDGFIAANTGSKGFAPWLLCGLAFAGANRGALADGRVPGIMTAEELAGIDLSACELAVLSACETNVGIRRAGQGIQSLQTALHAAGARTAITSLWKVDDAATRKLMERFYTYLWVEEMGKADALWKAKCDLRAEGHPVRDWAAWVLSGDAE